MRGNHPVIRETRPAEGGQLELPAVYPDTIAPIIKLDENGARNLTMMRWGFPPSSNSLQIEPST